MCSHLTHIRQKLLVETWNANPTLPKSSATTDLTPQATPPPKQNGVNHATPTHTEAESQSVDVVTTKVAGPSRLPTPEEEVEMSPEPEIEPAKPAEANELIRRLEKGMPKWKGLHDLGWMPEVEGVSICRVIPEMSAHKPQDMHLHFTSILHLLKGYKDARFVRASCKRFSYLTVSSGHRPSDNVEDVPEESTVRDLSYTVTSFRYESVFRLLISLRNLFLSSLSRFVLD